MLREVAARLVGCLRATDEVAPVDADTNSAGMVARLGGDEFIVLLRDLLAPHDAVVVATRMINASSTAFMVEGHEPVVTASLGIAMYPTDGDSGKALVKAADSAMYAAKSDGRNNFQFYSAQMNAAALRKAQLRGPIAPWH